MKILVLCTGNSCRSQMAEAFLKELDPRLDVVSAGTKPSEKVHPLTVKVMDEAGIDLSANFPKNVSLFLREAFDYVITVCDGAKESCPLFTGKVKERRHIGFVDPAEAVGTDEEILRIFRDVRDQIRDAMGDFYRKSLSH